VPKGKTYYDPADPDWTNLLQEADISEKELRKHILEDGWSTNPMRLRPDVLAWLHNNVKPRKGWDQPQGWAIGNDEYNSRDGISFSIFFHRQTDAMKFIRTWSIYKKPVSFLNYFEAYRRELINGKLVKVKR
jgi:hypothetical protein